MSARPGLTVPPARSPATAWLTIGKALGAAGIASGDTVYVGAGVYREAVTVAMTSATVETKIVGDVDGSHTGDAGDVIWSSYTTSDVVAAAASACLGLAGRDFLTFENIVFNGGNTAVTCVNGATTNALSNKFTRCVFIPGIAAATLVQYIGLADVASAWTFDSCVFLVSGQSGVGISVTLPTSASADYDTNMQIKNCLFVMGNACSGVTVLASGAAAFKGGGVDVFNSTFIGGAKRSASNVANLSTSHPMHRLQQPDLPQQRRSPREHVRADRRGLQHHQLHDPEDERVDGDEQQGRRHLPVRDAPRVRPVVHAGPESEDVRDAARSRAGSRVREPAGTRPLTSSCPQVGHGYGCVGAPFVRLPVLLRIPSTIGMPPNRYRPTAPATPSANATGMPQASNTNIATTTPVSSKTITTLPPGAPHRGRRWPGRACGR